MFESDETALLNKTCYNIKDQCFQFIFDIFYNIMFYNPFESRVSRASLPPKELDFHSSQLSSRSIIQLEISKPLRLMGQSTASNQYSINTHSSKHYNTSEPNSIVSSHREVIGHKLNPFISAKAYEYKPIAYPNSQPQGLFLWQKNKYLSMYGVKTSNQERGAYFQANIQEQHPLQKSKAERVQQIPSEVVISSPSSKQQIKQHDKPVSYRKDSFNAPENAKSEASIINDLNNIAETKPTQQVQLTRMESSKVFQYQFGTNLNMQNNQDGQYNFDTGKLLRLTEAHQELDETSKFNSMRPPLSINLGSTVYELITLY